MFVVVEYDSPFGNQIVLEARESIFAFIDVEERKRVMLAPCPHIGRCPFSETIPVIPMAGKENPLYCRFSQRLQLTRYMMSLFGRKRSDPNLVDVGYTYVAFHKPSRETHHLHDRAGLSDDEDTAKNPLAAVVIVEEEQMPETRKARIVQTPPKKRSGHVIISLCTPEGHLSERIYSRSLGKDWYTSGRKAHLGDAIAIPPLKQPKQTKTQLIMAAMRAKQGKALALKAVNTLTTNPV